MDEIVSFFAWINESVFAIPATILFFGVAILLTIKTGFMQFRGFGRFIQLITQGVEGTKQEDKANKMKTINSFHALFAAMATTIGMGNIVGPSIAIMSGGPGALFWILVYMFFGSATKFTEVTYALHTRIKTEDGKIIGGPMQYLKSVSTFLASWYGVIMAFLFIYWSSVQSNTLASIFAIENVPEWTVGLTLAVLVFVVLGGGAKRVGALASKLVPIMFFLYICFALFILLANPVSLQNAFKLILQSILSPAAAMGGFLGASVFKAMHAGIYRGIYISESGLGVSSIPHSMADTERPLDQGILAMYSAIADMILCTISGLLVLVTGVWTQGEFRSTLAYEVFKMHSPVYGQLVLLISISLFVLTTVIGNSFNGMQSFAALTRHRWLKPYKFFTIIGIFLGALMPVTLAWQIMDTMLTLAAVPNLIGLVILAFTKPEVLRDEPVKK